MTNVPAEAWASRELATDLDGAIERVTAALAEQGFGILTRIDLHEAFADKLEATLR